MSHINQSYLYAWVVEVHKHDKGRKYPIQTFLVILEYQAFCSERIEVESSKRLVQACRFLLDIVLKHNIVFRYINFSVTQFFGETKFFELSRFSSNRVFRIIEFFEKSRFSRKRIFSKNLPECFAHSMKIFESSRL